MAQVPSTATTIPLVDLRRQYESIKDEIDTAMASVITQSAFVGGAFVRTFEEQFARYCGVEHCIGVANGTDALFIALRALGVGPGDEVITVANSFVATSEAIRMTGAQVVFVDIEPLTYCIDVEQIQAKITSRTKVLVPVHLYGQPADVDPILALARKYGLRVVGDAAQAHGALYKGRPLSQLADITCFSFYPSKNLGAYGDAGALVTNNPSWGDQARMLANHGRTSKYDHASDGMNSRLDGLQAAILSAKLFHLDDWNACRRANADRYNEALQGAGVATPAELDAVTSVYHLYVIRVTRGSRDTLQQHLREHGISTGIHYPIALPFLNAYRDLGHQPSDFPESLKASSEILSLPMYPELSREQIHYIADTIANRHLR